MKMMTKQCLNAVRMMSIGMILMNSVGCTRSEIFQQTSDTADQTLFDQNAPSKTWDPDAAPALNLPDVNAYVQTIVERISKNAEMHGGYAFRISDEPMVNGGSGLGAITLTRGMLNACQNEAELAAYIGHEIGHKDLRSQRAALQPQGLWRKTFDKGLTYASENAGFDTSAIRKQADDVMRARYSQIDEERADEYGATLAAKAGYNPYAFAELFEWLSQRVTKVVGYRVAKLKGTHKALDARAAHLRKFLAKNGFKNSGEIAAERYQSELASLVAYDAKKSGVTTSQENALQEKLDGVEKEIRGYQKFGKQIPVVRFVAMMRILADVRRAAHPVRISMLHMPSVAQSFMEEFLTQTMPSWGDGVLGVPFARANGLMQTLSNSVVAIGPGLSGTIGLFEFLTGNAFESGESLGAKDLTTLARNLIASTDNTSQAIGDSLRRALQMMSDVGIVDSSAALSGTQAIHDAITTASPAPSSAKGDPIPAKTRIQEGDFPVEKPIPTPATPEPRKKPSLPQRDQLPDNPASQIDTANSKDSDEKHNRDGTEEDALEIDSTGKIHGDIPDHIPENWTTDDLEISKSNLEKSLNKRQEEQKRYGEDGAHRERMRQEEKLLRQINKKLNNS